LRCQQIKDALQARGMPVALYDSQAPVAADVLVLSKRYDPRSMEIAVEQRARYGTRLVLDLCDNHFHVAKPDPALEERAEHLRHAVAAVDSVVAASRALADIVGQEANPKAPPTVIPDAAELPFEPSLSARLARWKEEMALMQLHRQLEKSGVARERRLLWFGHHGSAGVEGGMSDLALIRQHCADAREPVSLTVISNDRTKSQQLLRDWPCPTHYLSWSQHVFSRAARMHSVVVIPVSLNPFTHCKTNNRLATAFLHGLNVVATGIDSYAEFRECAVLDDWARGLGPYLSNPEQRARDVGFGSRLIADRYSLPRIADAWQQFFLESTPSRRVAH
jgi:hypothetical protein